MTDPLSSLHRLSRTSPADRAPATDKAEPRTAQAAGQPVARPAPAGPGADRLELSDVARSAMQEPSFDRAKVEAIKQALKEGQYPLDSRRIAENFMAIEQMIKG